MSTCKDSPRQRRVTFGYREALAELAASNARRLEAERAARRERWELRSLLLDQRGLAPLGR